MNDELYINGEVIEEPHLIDYKKNVYHSIRLTINFTIDELTNEMKVPEGHYFVMGDNRRYSTDSRDSTIGFVSTEAINSKVFTILFPFKDIKIVD